MKDVSIPCFAHLPPSRSSSSRHRTITRTAIAAATAALLLIVPRAHPETAPPTHSDATKIAAVTSLRIVQEKDGPALEILSTSPLVPSIKALDNPPRLVIDLPNSELEAPKRIDINADGITALRANQFQKSPPITRVVVDLQAPRPFTWDAAGNRIIIHLGKNPAQTSESPYQPPTVPSLASAPPPAIAAVRAAGPLTIAGDTSGTGSTIRAGSETATLALSSGGEVRVCPGTTLSAVPSANRHNVMLSMNTGALEAHLILDASSDSVLTPDFRVTFPGPGEFHYAISADSQGNTCVRSLPGNTAAATVTEVLGERSYQLKATDQLIFRGGQLDRMDTAVPLECGCPPPSETPLRAANDVPVEKNINTNNAENNLPANADPSPAEAANRETSGVAVPAPDPQNPDPQNNVHVQVSAPFIFHADGPPPAPVEDVKSLLPDSRPPAANAASDPASASAPPTSQAISVGNPELVKKQPRSFFKKIGAFFSSLFH